MAEIHGSCADGFGAVGETLAGLLDGADVGASAAVYLGGEPVADVWGGYADEARTVPWERDTITGVWSTTKTMTALCALVLADRGDLDLDAPVARYWPEFAAAGKEGVLVRHVLSHTAGLPTFDEPITIEELYDGETAAARLAAQAPQWEPGTEAGYHAVTFGVLAGEVVRRITGRDLGAFFAAEVAGPLGADFHIGLPAEHDHRVAPMIPPAPRSPDAPPSPRDESGNPPIPPTAVNTVAWRRAGLAAAGGFGNARSVAAVQSVLAAGGTARGVRLLSRAGCERALETQFTGVDRVLGVRMGYGIGYGKYSGERSRTCFWGGHGGSMVLIDLDARLTVAYVMNRMVDEGTPGDERGLAVVMAAYEGVSAAA